MIYAVVLVGTDGTINHYNYGYLCRFHNDENVCMQTQFILVNTKFFKTCIFIHNVAFL